MLSRVLTCWEDGIDLTASERLLQLRLGKPRTPSSVTSALALCFATAVAFFPVLSQRLSAMLSQIKSPWISFAVQFNLSCSFLVLSLSLHDFCTHRLHYQSHSDCPSSPWKVTKILPRFSCLCYFLHVLFNSFFYRRPSLLYLTTVSDRNPMLTTSLSADLVPLASWPSISLGQSALRHKSLLKVRTPNHQNWSCCFTVSPEKSGLSDLIKALFMGGTPLLEWDEMLPLKRNLHQIRSV